jgi:chromosome segregation ATPase
MPHLLAFGQNEMMELRKQVNTLNNHLEFLRSKHKMLRRDGAVAEWEERAMAQRHKRRQAEDLNDQLKRALFDQRGFIRDLKSVFSSSPMHSTVRTIYYYVDDSLCACV